MVETVKLKSEILKLFGVLIELGFNDTSTLVGHFGVYLRDKVLEKMMKIINSRVSS